MVAYGGKATPEGFSPAERGRDVEREIDDSKKHAMI